MDNAKQQNVISVNSQVMELQQLIAGPLVSTIEADTLSSRRYLEMLQLIAFEDVTEGDVIAGHMPVTQEWLQQRRVTQVDALRLVQGRGSSMEPTFKDGDLLLVNTAQRDAERVPGVYVLRADGQLFVKRVQHGMNGAAFVSSDNPAIKLVEPLQGGYPIDVLGRVLWVWKREEIR